MSSHCSSFAPVRPLLLLGMALACVLAMSACRQAPADAAETAPQAASFPASAQPAMPADAESPATADVAVGGAIFPPELCASDQGWSFLNAFVLADEATRRRYSEGDAADDFRIAMVDSRWSIREPAGASDEYSRVELQEIPSDQGFVLEYVRARYAPNEDVESTYGEPGRYVFAIRDGCWKLLGRPE